MIVYSRIGKNILMKKGPFTCWLEKWLTYKIKGPFRKLTTLS